MILRQVASASVIFAAGRFANIIFIFVFNALLVRLLIKQDIGHFVMTFSIINFFSLIANFGTGNIAIKWFGELINRQRTGQALSLFYSFLLVNILTAIGAALLIYCLQFFNIFYWVNIDYSYDLLIILSCWIWAQGLLVLLTEILRAFSKFVFTTLSAGVLVNLLNLILLYLFITRDQSNQSFESIVFTVALNAVLVSCLILFVVRKICCNFDLSENVSTQLTDRSSIIQIAKQIVMVSMPSFVNKLGLYLTVIVDIWLISAFYNKSLLADYGIAIKLATALSIFLVIANGFVPTFISQLQSKGSDAVEVFLRTVATLVAIPTLLLFCLLYFKSDTVISLIFGEQYISAVPFLQVLLLAQLVNVFAGSCSYTLVMQGKNKQLMFISIFTGLLAVLSALFCIYLQLGVLSIVWVFVLSAILRQVAIYLVARTLCNINTAVYLNPMMLIKNFKQLY